MLGGVAPSRLIGSAGGGVPKSVCAPRGTTGMLADTALRA